MPIYFVFPSNSFSIFYLDLLLSGSTAASKWFSCILLCFASTALSKHELLLTPALSRGQKPKDPKDRETSKGAQTQSATGV